MNLRMEREADIARVPQIILDDLRKAECTLADASAAVPDPERAAHLRAVRTAITTLETAVVLPPEPSGEIRGQVDNRQDD
jgi:hypothetical protein